MILGFISYLFVIIPRMQSGENDQITDYVMTNQPLSKDGVKNIDMSKDVFMPVIEIYPQGTLSSIQHLKIFEDDTDVFDISKINEFIEIYAVQRNRDEGREFGFLQNMRYCTKYDFEKHRFELDSAQTTKIK